MKYVKTYSGEWDLVFQSEVSDETAAKMSNVEISDTPFAGVIVLPRNRSEWDLDAINKHLDNRRD